MTREQITKALQLATSRELAAALAGKRKKCKGGRPLSGDIRCKCGAMTLKRALARRHKCVTPDSA